MKGVRTSKNDKRLLEKLPFLQEKILNNSFIFKCEFIYIFCQIYNTVELKKVLLKFNEFSVNINVKNVNRNSFDLK